MMKRYIPNLLAAACLTLTVGLAGAQTKTITTPPQAYPKGQAVGAEGTPLTLEECKTHMAMAKDSGKSNDPMMVRKGEQCAQMMSSDSTPVTKMPGEKSSAATPTQAYPQGHAKGAEGKAGMSNMKNSGITNGANSSTVTPPQAYPKGQAKGAEATNTPSK